MLGNVFAVGPFTGYARTTGIRLWAAVASADVHAAVVGAVRWKPVDQADFSAEHRALFAINPHFDGAGIIDIQGLEPDVRYEFQACYISSAIDLATIEWPDAPGSRCQASTVASASGQGETSFFLGSCRHHGPQQGGQSDKAFETMNALVDNGTIPVPDMLWMIGDQIYRDGPHQLPLTGFDYFREIYRQQYSEPQFTRLMQRVPAYLQMDDHEVHNDWAYNKMQSDSKIALLRDGMRGFDAFQAALGPVFTPETFQSTNATASSERPYWYDIERGDCAFFILDVRHDRNKNQHRWWFRSSGEEGQLNQLLQFIQTADSQKVNFIVSPVPMFPDAKKDFVANVLNWFGAAGAYKELWTSNYQDRKVILDAIDSSDAKFVILSGDVHCSFTARLVLSSGKVVHNVVSSAFNWMLPGLRKSAFRWGALRGMAHDVSGVELLAGKVETDNNFTHLAVKDDLSVVVSVYRAADGQCSSGPFSI